MIRCRSTARSARTVEYTMPMTGLPSGAGGAGCQLSTQEGDQVGDRVEVLRDHLVVTYSNAVRPLDVRDQLQDPRGVHDPGLEERAAVGHARGVPAEQEVPLDEGSDVV